MMSGVFRNPGYDKHAYTDVYDPKTRRILVRFPHGLLLALALSGVIAFGLMGYFGYLEDKTLLGLAFHKAWPLFLWFSALVFTLEIAVLRHPRLRRQLTEALVVTIICMIFVGFTALDPGLLHYILTTLLNIRIAIPQIGTSPWTYAIINFGVLTIFWLDTIRRWGRSRSDQGGESIGREFSLGFGSVAVVESADLPTLPELIAGDLIAGGVLAGVLSLIFHAEVINPLTDALQMGVHITTCTVSWPIGHCVGGGGLTDPPTLSKIDLIQALIYLPLGFITLALTATANAFNAASGQEEVGGGYEPAPGTAIATGEQSRAVSTEVVQQPAQVEGGRQSATVSVTGTIIDALRSALSRRIRIAIDNLLVALRNVVWPLFILLGMVALGQAAQNIAVYLHLQSDKITCARTNNAYPDPVTCQAALEKLSQYVHYQDLAASVALVIAAAVALTLALMMLVFELRVADNTFRFLGLVTYVGALTLWIFSLALSLSNAFFNLVGWTQREPFPFFGASTTASLLIFLIATLFLVLGRGRRARTRSRATREPLGIGAGNG